MFRTPLAWGTLNGLEAVFVTYIELLHDIDHPDCPVRCAWNCHVSHTVAKFQRSLTLVGCLREDNPAMQNDRLVALLMRELGEIWLRLRREHPIKLTL